MLLSHKVKYHHVFVVTVLNVQFFVQFTDIAIKNGTSPSEFTRSVLRHKIVFVTDLPFF